MTHLRRGSEIIQSTINIFQELRKTYSNTILGRMGSAIDDGGKVDGTPEMIVRGRWYLYASTKYA